jgi:hypothetical protein
MVNNPDKSLRDIEFFLNRMKNPNHHSAYKILFFDDRPDHVLKSQIPLEHYIQVTPFGTNLFDSTPWDYVMGLLKGGRKTRKRKNVKN